MKIKRTIYHKEGYKKVGQEVEFELTHEEMRQAFEEQELNYDREDVEDLFALFKDEEFSEIYGIDKEEAYQLLDKIAIESRKNISEYGMHWDDARQDAARTIISQHLQSKEKK